jgi:transcriptional regulator with XRE-family HTH domain
MSGPPPTETVSDRRLDFGTLDWMRERLQLTEAELAAIVGVDTSTLFRWRKGTSTPRPMAFSRLAQLDELAEMLRRLFAGADLARDWLRSATPEMLDGATPLDVMRAGRTDRVLTLLHFLARGA